jgi:DNA-binding PadR family transcriptional regulator
MDQEIPLDTAKPPDRLALLQRAFLLEQLAAPGAGSATAGALNKKITVAAARALQLTAAVANGVRGELVAEGFLFSESKSGRKVLYAITEAGRHYLDGLERPTIAGRRQQPAMVDESDIPPELREGQKAFLLLQLLDNDGQPLARGDANRIRDALQKSLGLKPAIANHLRAKLAEQGYIQITVAGRSQEYVLTPDGLEYLAAGARHLEHADLTIKGKTLNALIAAARQSSFDREQSDETPLAKHAAPSQAELAQAVLSEFQDLRRERYGRSGLVPIHEVRQRLIDRFGPGAGRHDVLDEVILGLWRQQRLGLEAISDLAETTQQQLNDSIQGVHGTLFYLEMPSEQPVVSESLRG